MTDDISPLIRKQAPLILEEIKKAKSILLHCHPSPDPDSVGSALAMKFALEQLGKKATVIKGDSEIPEAFMHFPGATEIVQKNFFEVDLKQFDLFIVLDAGSKEMISRIKPIELPLAVRTVVIDHHASNKSYGDMNLVDLGSPSATFILYQLFKLWNLAISKEIALNLFVGMYTDSGGFKYPPTDYRVFLAASDLVRIVPEYIKALFIMENSEHKESIFFRALALGSIENFFNENIALASVSYADLESRGISIEFTHGEGIPNTLKSVIGWNVGIILIEVEPNKVKVSMRTRDAEKFDVSKLAVILGGGGHRAAAGAVLSMSLPEAKKLVVAKAKELYNL